MSGSESTTTIIISNQSLVLQGVSRHEAGHYTCGAENAEGPGPHSKPIYLDVLCEFQYVCKKIFLLIQNKETHYLKICIKYYTYSPSPFFPLFVVG